MKTKSEFKRNVYIVSLLVYYAQGGLYESGSILSQLALLTNILIGLIHFSKSMTKANLKNALFLAWTLLLGLNFIGFVFTSDFSNSLHLSNFKSILFTSLTFYTIYDFTKSGIWSEKNLLTFLLLMFPISILQFYHYEKQQFILYNETTVVNNISYVFVGFIPFLFFIKKKILLLLSIAIILFFVIISGKRGASIAAFSGLLIFAFYYFRQIGIKSQLQRVMSYIGFTFIASGILFSLNTYLQNNSLLKNRISSGYASHRDSNYMNIASYWYNSESYLNLIFGYGFASSEYMNEEGVLAHNDWLELLSNFGLIGVFIYLFSVFAFIRIIKSTANIKLKYSLISIFFIWMLVSLFSMFYNNIDSFLYAMIIASTLGWQTKKNIENENSVLHR